MGARPYISSHSTFSRAAAEVLTRFTGSPYFPGGLGEFRAPQGTFLRNGIGPTQDVVLQWASYYDAADQAGISRLWGGIHIPADDFNGRRTGARVGVDAFDLAQRYFAGDRPETASRVGKQSARMAPGGEGERRAAAGEAGAADFHERERVSGSAS